MAFWYLAKLHEQEGYRGPATADYSEGLQPIREAYPDGRILKVLADRLGDGKCLCKWEGTPPMDWKQLNMEQAKQHFKDRMGVPGEGVD